MFEELCGKNTLWKVILTTTITMWDEVDQEMGKTQEGELISTYWQPILQHNSMTSRFRQTHKSAFTVIDPLIDTANIQILVLLQQELADKCKKSSLTSQDAGQELLSTMEPLLQQHEDLFCRIRNEVKCEVAESVMR